MCVSFLLHIALSFIEDWGRLELFLFPVESTNLLFCYRMHVGKVSIISLPICVNINVVLLQFCSTVCIVSPIFSK